MIKTVFALNIRKTAVSCKNTLNVLPHKTTVFIIIFYSILFYFILTFLAFDHFFAPTAITLT